MLVKMLGGSLPDWQTCCSCLGWEQTLSCYPWVHEELAGSRLERSRTDSTEGSGAEEACQEPERGAEVERETEITDNGEIISN